MNTKTWRLISSVFLLLAFALAGASCDGFFVDPTLTSVSVGPQNLSIQINEQWKMSATGTYSDGSQKTLTSGVVWFSGDSAVASVGESSGQVTGLTIGSATISASSGSCSACTGSTTVTVVLQGVKSIVVSPGEQTENIQGRREEHSSGKCSIEQPATNSSQLGSIREFCTICDQFGQL